MGIRESLGNSLGNLVGTAPLTALVDNALTRSVWERITGGDEVESARETGQRLADEGFLVAYERSLVHTEDLDARSTAWADVLRLIDQVADQAAEIALFWDRWTDDEVRDLARRCTQARVRLVLGYRHGVDMDRTWAMADELTASGADFSVTVCAALRRSEADIKQHSSTNIRVIKGSGWATGGDTFSSRHEVDKSYVRCAKASLSGAGQVSFATHDSRIMDVVSALIDRYHRDWASVEFALYLGRRIGEAERMRDAGYPVRIYIPFGPERKERIVSGLVGEPLVSALVSVVPGRRS